MVYALYLPRLYALDSWFPATLHPTENYPALGSLYA